MRQTSALPSVHTYGAGEGPTCIEGTTDRPAWVSVLCTLVHHFVNEVEKAGTLTLRYPSAYFGGVLPSFLFSLLRGKASREVWRVCGPRS